MEVEVAKITLSDTIPAQHQIMRQQKGVKTSKPAKHTSSSSSTQQHYCAFPSNGKFIKFSNGFPLCLPLPSFFGYSL